MFKLFGSVYLIYTLQEHKPSAKVIAKVIGFKFMNKTVDWCFYLINRTIAFHSDKQQDDVYHFFKLAFAMYVTLASQFSIISNHRAYEENLTYQVSVRSRPIRLLPNVNLETYLLKIAIILCRNSCGNLGHSTNIIVPIKNRFF